MTTNVKSLGEHEFVQEVLKQLQPMWSRILEERKEGAGQVRTPPILSEIEAYNADVFGSLARIMSSYETLSHIRVYIKFFRKRKTYDKYGIDRAKYIQYHYSNHAVISVGIADQALILTNYVFRLGLPEKLCKPDIITKNLWVKSARLDETLRKVQKAVEPLREPRNLYLHRGHVRENELLSSLAILEYTSGSLR